MINTKSAVAALVIAFMGSAPASYASEIPPDGQPGVQHPDRLVNSDVVETDHGQGLGPNGVDLHYDEGASSASSAGAELTRRVLDQPLVVDGGNSPEDDLVSVIEGG